MRMNLMLVISGLAGLASLASGQQRPEPVLKPGARIRYELPRSSHRFRGVIETIDTVRIVVRPEGSDLHIQLGLDSLRSLSILEGVRSSADGARRGAWAGLQIGVLVGTVATTAVWLSSADERCDDCFISATAATIGLSVTGTLGLSLLGAALGASAPGEVWTEIPLPRSRRRGG